MKTTNAPAVLHIQKGSSRPSIVVASWWTKFFPTETIARLTNTAKKHIAQGEGDIGTFPFQIAWPKCGSVLRPSQIRIAKSLTQKGFFRKHDALVVQPVEQTADDGEPDVSHIDHDPEPHEKVTEIQWVPYQAVHAFRVQNFGDLTVLGIAT